jgi:hypothetical protein
MQLEAFLLLAMPKAVDKDIPVGFAGKNIYPPTTANVIK